MCPTLENIRKTSDKNSRRNWPLLWSFHMHVRDWKGSKQRKMWNKSFAVAAFYRHPHQLQAPPSVIQYSARDATFVRDQSTRKPNSTAVSAITCVQRAQQTVVQTMPGVKVRPTDDTICKIIRNPHMKCCGIFFGFCNPFFVYFSICFYIFKSS
jgi:hypothetical protein